MKMLSPMGSGVEAWCSLTALADSSAHTMMHKQRLQTQQTMCWSDNVLNAQQWAEH